MNMFSLLLSLAMADNTHPCGDDSACLAIMHAEPSQTRNPALYRFADPEVRDPKWTFVHVHRLLNQDLEEPVMLALMALLQNTDLTAYERELTQLRLHSSPDIRAGFVEVIPQFSEEAQSISLNSLKSDEDWLVRETVQRVVARHLGTTHPTILLSGLQDPELAVQVQAVKGLGWNEISFSIDTVIPLLQNTDPHVRVTTIRAIERAMPQALQKHPIFESLKNDPNPKVQREIQRLYPQ